MVQFLLGFWCGSVVTIIFCCVLYYLKRRRRIRAAGGEKKETGVKAKGGGEKNFFVPAARVLLVDDSKLSRKFIKDFLKHTGIEFAEAGNGEECILKIKRNSFDLVFMDLNMPGGDGVQILERIRKETKESTLPVVVMGSDVRRESEEKYLKQGFAGCLAKPIQKNRLEELISQLIPEKMSDQIPAGFSYQKGLKNFDGNEEVYKETLVLFSSLWKERKEQLKQFLAEENMPDYAILIHAIKGDARILGAEGLAELAYSQEISAKESNVEAVRNSFSEVIETGTKTAEYFANAFSA